MADDQNPQLPLEGGTPPNSGTNYLPMNIEEEMRRSYLAYSMSVIVGRALPDARDGLKPVHRRILTAMDREGLQHNKRYSKCAGVVGECLKKYHPHGDSSVYDALVRMAQPWSLRYPLVDGQGNFGSVDGDPPAAYRYTECRMERIAEEMMADIEMETVDMVPNFDETTDEPSVLPTRIPTLIVNGSNGIAVGMATNIPPHNLTEIINATIELVNDPRAGLLEVLRHVQGPVIAPAEQTIAEQIATSAPQVSSESQLPEIRQEVQIHFREPEPPVIAPRRGEGGLRVNSRRSEPQPEFVAFDIPEALAIATRALDWFKTEIERFREEIRCFANFPTLFMGLVGDDGTLEHYSGKLRFLDAGGHVVADYPDTTYPDYLAEIAHPWSYLK